MSSSDYPIFLFVSTPPQISLYTIWMEKSFAEHGSRSMEDATFGKKEVRFWQLHPTLPTQTHMQVKSIFRICYSKLKSTWCDSCTLKMKLEDCFLCSIILLTFFLDLIRQAAQCSDGSGSRSGQPSFVWVWLWKISPKKSQILIFSPSGQKKSHRVRSKSTRVEEGSGSYLLRVKSMLRLGQGRSLTLCNNLWWKIHKVYLLSKNVYKNCNGYLLNLQLMVIFIFD